MTSSQMSKPSKRAMSLGSSVEEAFRVTTEGLFARQPSFDVLYPRLAAEEANRLRQRYGDSRIREILAQVILKESFVIGRSTTR